MGMHLTRNVTGLNPSATLAINEMIVNLRRQGQEVYHLGFGEAPFPVHETIQRALSENTWRKSYLPTQGILELREQVSEFYSENFNLDYSPEQILA